MQIHSSSVDDASKALSAFTRTFFKELPPVRENYTTLSDEELLADLQKYSDFDRLVFPNEWYSKFQLPEKKCLNMKEFLKESPWMKTSQHFYIGKEELPPKPGGLKPILPAEEVPIKILQINSFSDGPMSTDQTEPSDQQVTHES